MKIESTTRIENKEPFLEGEMETNEKIWEELRKKVEELYRENKIPEELIKQFIIHNKQAEDFVRKFSNEEKFNDKEKEIAILAAILHDITKGWGDFLRHGEEGGEMAEKILLEMGVSSGLAESVKLAIERHMGQEGYPTKVAKEKLGSDFEFPKYATKVGQMVYECDILSQLTKEGINKILLLRINDPEDMKKDGNQAREEEISIEEARIRSALESAKESYKLIKLESVKKYADKLWEETIKEYNNYFDRV